MIWCFEKCFRGYLLNLLCIKIAYDICLIYTKTFKTVVQGEINKILQISGVEECHLVVGFKNALVTRSRFERVWKSGLHKVSWQIVNFLGKLMKLLPHTFETPTHPWNQKLQKIHHRNLLKNGSLSKNVVKECERVLFQPLHCKRYRRGWRCGHSATWADLVAFIVFEILPFLWTHFVKSKFK